jgi:hypothetical protein
MTPTADGTRLCLCVNGPIVHPQDKIRVNIKQWWNDTDRGKGKDLRDKPVPVPLFHHKSQLTDVDIKTGYWHEACK